MARQLQIIKLSDKVWKHIDSITGAYILTKFYAKEDDSKFLVVEVYGSRRYEYAIEDISVYNIGGGAETFTNFDDLFLRLEVLKYTGFYVDGEFVFNPSAYDLSEFQNTETDRFAKLSDITGGGGAVDSVNGQTGVVVLDTGDVPEVTDKNYVTDAEQTAIGTISSKQDTLISGTNIRTINGQTLLGSSDLVVGSTIDLTLFPNRLEYKAISSGFVQIGAYSVLAITGTQSNASTNGGSISLRKILSDSTAGSSARAYQGSIFFVGQGQGFYFDQRINEIDDAVVADSRCSYGLGGTALIGNIEPSAYASGLCSFGHESTDTYFNILYKDTTLNKISLGINFPKNSNHQYHVIFFRIPNTTTFNYYIRNITNGSIANGTFTYPNFIPSLTPNNYRNNNTTAISVGYGINRIVTLTSDE